MLTLQRTAAPVRTERESIAMVYNYGNGRTSVEHVPAVTAPVVNALSISNKIIADSNARKSAKTAADHAEFSSHDWTTKPSSWSREAVLYYLEFICGETVTNEDRDGTDIVTVQNLARAEYKFRKENTQHASARVPRAALLNAVKNAKKLNPRSPAKTVSLSINGSLDVITSDHAARFSQCLSYIEKCGDLRLTFPEQRLNAIASKLKADILDLKLTSLPAFEEYTLTVRSADAEFTMPVSIPDDTDRFSSEFPADYAHNVKAGDLLHAFRMTEFATESESTRYALNGLFIVPAVDSLTIAATDSRRLSVETVSAELLGEMPELQKESYYHSRGVCIPAGIISLLSDELKRQKASDIVSFAVADVVISKHEIQPADSLTAKQKQNWKPDIIGHVATMDDGSTVRTHESADGTFWQETTRKEFVFEMPEVFSVRGIPNTGRFPRYMDVIPKSFGSDFVLNRVALLNACETVMLSTDAESRGVDFCFPDNNSEQTLTLKGQSETAKGVFRAAVDHVRSYDSHTITLDPVYLIDYLKRQASCDVRISLNDAESPILITEETNGLPSGNYVVMPLARDR